MGVKLGLVVWRSNEDWRYSRMWRWGKYFDKTRRKWQGDGKICFL